MNDYLWDKTGEKDAEVERLEELLGGLRYTPRELELPHAPAPPHARTGPRFFRFAAFAAAAAIALAALAGLLVAVRQQQGAGTAPVAASDTRGRGARGGVESAANSAAVPDSFDSPKGLSEAAPQKAASTTHGARRAAARQTRGPSRPAVRARGAGAEAGAVGGEEVASLPEGRRTEAKEQLLYALRLASAELEDVRKKALGADGGKDGTR